MTDAGATPVRCAYDGERCVRCGESFLDQIIRGTDTQPCRGRLFTGAVRAAGERAPRILVTGSRDWADVGIIQRALAEAWDRLGRPDDATLVQGECHLGGADRIAADTWRAWGYPVEGHPAERGPDGRVLGPERNARMVALGADLCLAFPLPASRGTRNCMALARAAGIPVYEYAPTATT